MPSMLALLLQAWSGAYAVHGNVEQADCVVGFAFGRVLQGRAILPGNSNQELAAFAHDHCPGLPGILQYEIAAAYKRLDHAPGEAMHVVAAHRQPGRYLDTRELGDQAWQIMQARGWRTAVVLAQGHHMPRAIAVCRRLGMNTVAMPGLEQIGFCHGSAQLWTRNRTLWFAREVGAILHYRRLGWL